MLSAHALATRTSAPASNPDDNTMHAAMFRQFGGPITIETVTDPGCPPAGVVIAVRANGVCRSDWHGWMGHDPMIRLPHVPGHELAGMVVEAGPDCRNWRAGDRVTVPFVTACGRCAACHAGQHQVCHDPEQPGFSSWGAFAEHVAVDRADINLVALPESLEFVVAASLGCRFTTAFRGVIDRGRLQTGEWLAVHGCGGVGLSAVMIAAAEGAGVVAVDIDRGALAMARELGAAVLIDAGAEVDVAAAIHDATDGGAHVSIDALGHRDTCANSIRCLRTQGRHVQAGLLAGEHADPPIPMDAVIARELEIVGTHGMAAHRFPRLLDMIAGGSLDPRRLITRRIGLEAVPATLAAMDQEHEPGMTVMELP